ncbi:ABC transporter ATP-binding protein [Streptomyces sp. NBC_01451]|uniref:ABC transporter ATP-binding protein n=1 Tax=Streptomyces sp. NBC_01451 TaxID=2903872 RepID=UPI002E375FE1|nr:ATP-binding cassette domain-containing protein [Streptomyces sp. NBC_01451]
MDLIAVLALGGTLAVREYLAGAMIALMLATDHALEAAARRRASHGPRALLEHAPRAARRRSVDEHRTSAARLDDGTELPARARRGPSGPSADPCDPCLRWSGRTKLGTNAPDDCRGDVMNQPVGHPPGQDADRAVLDCAHLVRRFGDRTAVDDVSLSIARGETYGLLGPNGAGKTTTIRMVCGLLRPDAGTVHVAGRPVDTKAGPAKQLIGFVPQDVALYPDLSVRENLRFFGRLYRLPRRRLEHRVDEVLDLIDLGSRAGDRVDSLSGGMRRRLNIGAGLVHAPTLLVLDEPTVGVDPQSRHAILNSVTRFGEEGMAVLYTTHYMEEAERLCDRVGIIDRGRLVAEGSPRELVALVAERDRVRLTAVGDLTRYTEACRRFTRVEGAARTGDHGDVVEVVVKDARSLLTDLLDLAHTLDVDIRSVEIDEPDLEAVFLHLTGTALRE